MPPDGDYISFKGYSLFHHIACILSVYLFIIGMILLTEPGVSIIIKVIVFTLFVAGILRAIYMVVKDIVI